MRVVRRRAGFTLLEVCIAVLIMSLVAVNIALVSKTGASAMRAEAFRESLEDDLNRTLDRIKLSLMSSSASSLEGVSAAPLGSNQISFSTSLGLQDGELLNSDPERIEWTALGEDGGRVLWTQNPELAEERSVVWNNWVPLAFHDEVLGNALDENANGLNDENGLAFHLQEGGEKDVEIFIHLTVEKTNPDGNRVPIDRRVNITCRN